MKPFRAAILLSLLAGPALGQGAASPSAAPAPQGPSSTVSSGEVRTPSPAASDPAAPRPVPAREEREISVLVVAGQESVLSSQMAGKIRKIHVGLGDNVKTRSLLVEFDCAEQYSQLRTAEADYRAARETHLAKLKLQALGAAGELEVTVAAANADKAKSQVAYRQSQAAYCRVPAPFSGRVAKIRVKTAESVALGQPLLDVVNPQALKAQLYVPASWVQWLRTEMKFQVKTVDSNRVYTARVSKLNSRIEGVSQALEIEGQFEGDTRDLLPGMVGTALFPDRPGS